MNETNRASKDAELGIDILRGFASLGVLVAHSVEVVLVSHFGHATNSYPSVWRNISALLGQGVFWVWVFFIISGLCIHWSIERSTSGWADYALARFTRLYPLFLFGFLLTLLGGLITQHYNTKVAPTPALIAGTAIMCQRFTGVLPGFGASWSLTNEVIYYVLWPILLISFRSLVPRAAYFGAILSIALAITGALLAKLLIGNQHEHWLISLWTTLALFPLWIAGAVLAHYWVWICARISKPVALLSWFGLPIGLFSTYLLYRFEVRTYVHIAAAYVLSPLIVMTIAGLHHSRLSHYARLARMATLLGILSHPCYILHHPLLWTLHHSGILPQFGIPLDITIRIFVVLGVVILVGLPLERATSHWRKALLQRYRNSLPTSA